MTNVKAFGVDAQKPLHSCDQIGLRRFDDQVKMVAHQTIRMHLPLGLFAGFSQGRQKAAAVEVVLENVFTTIATIHEMVDGSRIFNPQLARHGGRFASHRKSRQVSEVSIVRTDTCPALPSEDDTCLVRTDTSLKSGCANLPRTRTAAEGR